MQSWPDRRLLDLLNLEIPIAQAPMAGSDSVEFARSVSSTGALGSLAAALLDPNGVREVVRAVREGVNRPLNLNFFCHTMTLPGTAAKEAWKTFLRPHYEHFGLDIEAVAESRLRLPFNEEMCEDVEEVGPEVVSFHFGLPARELVQRLKQHGVKILSSATSVDEAKWLEDHGCDAVIVQGFKAGGHRAMFLETNVWIVRSTAAGGRCCFGSGHCCRRIADARVIVAALALGASGVQMGTAYQLWAGQSARLVKPMPAGEFTRQLATDALRSLRAGSGA